MKLTKSDLKAILKECLRELIEEGIFSDMPAKPVNKKSSGDLKENNNNPFKNQIEARRLAQMIAGSSEEEIPGLSKMPMSAQINESRVNNLALEMAKGDKSKANVYAAIFADTAAHTLPNQLVNDTSSGGMPGVAAMTESVSMEEINGLTSGDSQRWAKIAFSSKKKLPG